MYDAPWARESSLFGWLSSGRAPEASSPIRNRNELWQKLSSLPCSVVVGVGYRDYFTEKKIAYAVVEVTLRTAYLKAKGRSGRMRVLANLDTADATQSLWRGLNNWCRFLWSLQDVALLPYSLYRSPAWVTHINDAS